MANELLKTYHSNYKYGLDLKFLYEMIIELLRQNTAMLQAHLWLFNTYQFSLCGV